MASQENEDGQKPNQDKLRQLEWLLDKNIQTTAEAEDPYKPYYGDVTELNTCRLIMDSVGKETLKDISEDAIDLLDTSVAIYEANGDYAFGMFSSGWCRLMDAASREFCQTDDNRKALDCGRWLCHENCWNDSATPAIESGQSTDIKCVGGINLYAEPIYAGGRIVGVINIGYGNPPKEVEQLKELAETFSIDFKRLSERANSYYSRPKFLVNLAKKRLRSAAKLIGEIVEKAQAEKALQESEKKFRKSEQLFSTHLLNSPVGAISWDLDFKVVEWNPAAEAIFDYTKEEAIGKHATELILPEEMKELVDGVFQDLLSDKGGKRSTNENITKDGKRIICDWYNTTLKDTDGKVTGVASFVHDITELKKAEEDLRESEKKARQYLDIAGVAFVALDNEGNITLINKRGLEILGYRGEELLGQNWFKTCLPERMTDDVLDVYHQLIRGEAEPVEYHENPVLTKEGKERIIAWHNSVLRNPDGEIVGILSSGEDITERKEVEDEKDAYREFLDSVPGYGFAKDINLTYLSATRPFCDLLKIPYDQIKGKTDYDIFPADLAKKYIDNDKRVMDTGQPLIVEEVTIDANTNQRFVVATRRHPSFDKNGNVTGIYGMGFDITEIKQAEEELNTSRDLLSSVLENIPIRVFWKDTDLRYLGCNTPFALDAGMLHPEDLIGKDDFEMGWSEEAESYRSDDKHVIDSDTPKLGYEELQTTPDGHKICLHSSKVPLHDAKGKVIGLLGIYDDITERKKAEKEQEQLRDQLAQSQKMEAVGTLSGGIAHDFNNILAIILGNAELAFDDVPEGNPATENLEEIRLASIRAKDMVRQLLSFSRKSDQKREPLNLVPIINESMKMLRTAIPSSVEFRVHILDHPCNIMGDVTQINQIMMNLTTNAAHAMSDEGLLEVTLQKVDLLEGNSCFGGTLSPGSYVCLKVRDTGEGMEPTTMARIFEPYYTTKEVDKGTGMGLSVVHGIVKRYDGGIRVESDPGKGTVFEIYFPALERMAEEEKKPEGEIKGGSERILFVDDEQSMVNLNHQRLERLGYQVKSTTKPVEALEWFMADPDQFDVIISDMTMPRMTGDRLTKEILTIRPEMLVIICTGYSERMSAEKAESLGVRKYLEKPIGVQNLAAALREVLDTGLIGAVPLKDSMAKS